MVKIQMIRGLEISCGAGHEMAANEQKESKRPGKSVCHEVENHQEKLKLNQDDFCKKVKISATQLSKIENGKNKPGHNFYYNLVKEFDVNLNYLLFDEGPMFRYSEKAGGEASTFPLDKFRRDYSRVNEEVDEFLFYFFKSAYFRFKIIFLDCPRFFYTRIFQRVSKFFGKDLRIDQIWPNKIRITRSLTGGLTF